VGGGVEGYVFELGGFVGGHWGEHGGEWVGEMLGERLLLGFGASGVLGGVMCESMERGFRDSVVSELYKRRVRVKDYCKADCGTSHECNLHTDSMHERGFVS
jgi:hypothetical protein